MVTFLMQSREVHVRESRERERESRKRREWEEVRMHVCVCVRGGRERERDGREKVERNNDIHNIAHLSDLLHLKQVL